MKKILSSLFVSTHIIRCRGLQCIGSKSVSYTTYRQYIGISNYYDYMLSVIKKVIKQTISKPTCKLSRFFKPTYGTFRTPIISFTRPVLVIPLAFSRSLTTPRMWSSTGMSLIIGGWRTGVGWGRVGWGGVVLVLCDYHF